MRYIEQIITISCRYTEESEGDNTGLLPVLVRHFTMCYAIANASLSILLYSDGTVPKPLTKEL